MTDWNIKPLVFVKDTDTGVVSVAEWFQRTLISPEFIVASDDTETVITFSVANGTRKYRFLEYDGAANIFTLELMDESA